MIKKALALLVAATAFQQVALAEDTIKIGVITVDTGPMQIYTSHTLDPGKFAIETLNAHGGALGRKYEMVQQGYDGTPAGAIAAVTKLAQQQHISLITGFNTSATSLAVSPRLASLNAILLDPSAQSDDLSGKGCQSNYFHMTINDSMTINSMRAVLKTSGIKTWSLLMPDYSLGHDFARKFTELVQQQGGSVESVVFAPMSTTDFGGYITQLSAKPTEGLAVVFPGAGGIALAKQQKQFGFFSKYKSVVSTAFTSELVIDAQGDSTVGVISTLPYSWQMPGATNAAFVKAFEEHFKRKPNYTDVDNFQAYELLDAAIKKANSTDANAVRAALSGLKATTPLGEVEIRAADHQLLRAMTVVQVTQDGPGKGAMTLRSVEAAADVAPPVSAACKM
ncbi:MAG: ABC transporter substrate-binding protein [Janthinobacterium lividum]